MNVWFKAAPADFQSTEGLCGTYDNKQSNDFLLSNGEYLKASSRRPVKFSRSWRVTQNSSLYDGFCGEEDQYKDSNQTVEEQTYCTCGDKQQAMCGQGFDLMSCTAIEERLNGPASEIKNIRGPAKDITAKLLETATVPGKCISKDQKERFEYDPDYESPITTWPTPSGMTEDAAEKYCRKRIQQSVSGKMCSKVKNVDFDTVIESCVQDIKLTDDKRWADDALESIKEQCLTSLEMDVEERENSEGPNSSILDSICPNECNQNGICQKGKCLCNKEYIGEDCSVKKSEPPQVISSRVDCVNMAQCKVYITGNNFVKSGDFVCSVTSYKRDFKTRIKNTKVAAVFETLNVAVCKLPGTGLYHMSLSNTGSTFSVELMILFYNPSCDICNFYTGCKTRTDVCRINNNCYLQGSLNPLNPALYCDTSFSSTEWTELPGKKIQIISLRFLRIEKQILYIPQNGRLTVVGDPKLIPGSRELKLELSGKGQSVKVDYINNCLFNPNTCTNGFTHSFTLSLLSYIDNSYILSICGGKDPYNGFAFYYEYKQLVFYVSTKTHIYTAKIADVTADTYQKEMEYQLSWSVEEGAKVYVNGINAAKSVQVERRIAITSPQSCNLTVGTDQLVQDVFTKMTISNWKVFFATRNILLKLGTNFGLPELITDPTLKLEYTKSTESVSYTCEFPELESSDVEYYVKWMVNGKNKWQDSSTSNGISVAEEEQLGPILYNSQIQCSVAVCLKEDCPKVFGKTKSSNIISVSIEVLTDKVVLEEGQAPKPIKIKSNVPPSVFCSKTERTKGSCNIQVKATVGSSRIKKCRNGLDRTQTVIMQSGKESVMENVCGIPINSDNWQNIQYLYIKATIDSLVEKTHEESVLISLLIHNQLKRVLFEVGRVKVKVLDKDKSALCKSINDPHMTTFDGRKYDNYNEGEFILYRHTTMPYEVRTFYRSCNGFASCNCAVAIRSGNDVILIDRCGPIARSFQTSMTTKLYLNGQLTPGTRIISFQGGQKYEVHLPTGAVVNIRQSSTKSQPFLNIMMKPSSLDYNSTQGLCGTYDTDLENDLLMSNGIVSTSKEQKPNKFSLSWRVKKEDTLYNGYCGSEDVDDDDDDDAIDQRYCKCVENKPEECGPNFDTINCNLPVEGKKQPKSLGLDITDSLVKIAESPKKCLTGSPSEGEFEYNSTYKGKEAQSNLTETESRKICTEVIENSAVGKQCKSVPNINYNEIIDSCVKDLVLTGNQDWTLSAQHNLEEDCLTNLKNNPSLWLSQDPKEPPQLPPTITDAFCPNKCNDRGICVEGVCECKDPYGGFDCSTNLNKPPTVDDSFILRPITVLDQLSNLVVRGEGFINGPKLFCFVNGTHISGYKSFTLKAKYISSGEILCSVPERGIQIVSVSNDKEVWSREIRVKHYDPLCETCTNDTCTPRNDVCTIEGICYSSGSVNPQDSGEMCIPEKSTSKWSRVKASDIVVSYYSIQNIDGDKLVTLHEKLKVRGNISLIQGPYEENAAVLNVGSNSVDMGNHVLCVSNLDKCTIGVTIHFNLILLKISKKMTIFSNSGQQANSEGIDMYIFNNYLFLSFKTTSKQWTVKTRAYPKKKFFKVLFSWSEGTGLYLYFNDKKVQHTTRYIKRGSTTVQKLKIISPLILGDHSNETLPASFAMEGWTVIQATKKLLEVNEFDFDLPVFKERPMLSLHGKLLSELKFRCFFKPLTKTDLKYTVYWYIDEDFINQSDIPNLNETYADIGVDYFKNLTYGSQVTCKVRTCLLSNCSHIYGPQRTSKPFIAELTVQDKTLQLIEGERHQFITIMGDIPPYLFCDTTNSTNYTSVCIFKVMTQMVTQKEFKCGNESIPQAVFMVQSDSKQKHEDCKYSITPENWNGEMKIPVLATSDGLRDGKQKGTVIISGQLMLNGKVEIEKKIGSVNLEIIDRDSKGVCKSINDPHMTTFDGRTYDNYFQGEFVLYRHKYLPYAVHTFYQSCASTVSCNCGVAVKSGDDVIVIDRCESTRRNRNQPILITLYNNGELTPGTRIYSLDGGNKFKVVLPTGAFVMVAKSEIASFGYINVWMQASPVDFKNTEGLCGNFDGRKDNDYITPDLKMIKTRNSQPKEFSLSWRVPDEDTIYNGFCEIQDNDSNNDLFCDCQQGKSFCSPGLNPYLCHGNTKKPNNKEKDITDVIKESNSESPPMKCISDDENSDFKYNKSYVPEDFTWPTKSGITEEQARKTCLEHIRKKKSAAKCLKTLPNTELVSTVKGCVQDIKIMDNTIWLNEALKNYLQTCLIDAGTNPDLKNNQTGNGTLEDDIRNNICPAECNNKGQCVNGVCICESKYGGADCSVDKTKLPIVSGINRKSCDTRVKRCKNVVITGQNFLDSSQLTCHFVYNTRKSQVPGQFLSKQRVRCSTDKSGVYNISISNDNGQESDGSVVFIKYDSTCEDCTENGCSLKSNLCQINGACYREYYLNPSKLDDVCLPSKSPSSWSVLKESIVTYKAITFLQIKDDILQTTYFKMSVFGRKPKLTIGPKRGKYIHIRQDGDYLMKSNLTSCLLDTSYCPYGFTGLFDLKINDMRRNVPILTANSDTDHGQGLKVFYRNNKLYIRVVKGRKVWTVFTSVRNRKGFFSVEFSWSEQFGLTLSINNQKKAHTNRFIVRQTINKNSTSLFIGTYFRKKALGRFIFGGLTVFNIERKVIDFFNIQTVSPELETIPEISIESSSDASDRNLSAVCRFVPLNRTDVSYIIQYIADEKDIYERYLADNVTEHQLHEDYIPQLQFGSKITCRIATCLTDRCDSLSSVWKESKPIVAEIQLLTKQLEIREGKSPKNIQMKTLFPPSWLCEPKDRKKSCQLTIKPTLSEVKKDIKCAETKHLVHQAVFAWRGKHSDSNNLCQYHVDLTQTTSVINIPIKATMDTLIDKDQERKVKMFANLWVDNILESTLLLGQVNVKIIDGDRPALCKSINDPHMTTFDNRHYDNFLEGEFVLYKHTTLPFEIHTFYLKCNGKASCNCAVSVKSEDDVILFDNCQSKKKGSEMRTKIFLNGKLNPLTKVLQFGEGRHFQV
ncbi:hypothetical protein Ahia01_001047900 [Argonauta hians]